MIYLLHYKRFVKPKKVHLYQPPTVWQLKNNGDRVVVGTKPPLIWTNKPETWKRV